MNVFDFRERGCSGLDPSLEDLAHAVIGAAIEVHRTLCPGLPENAYKNALEHELKLRGIQCQREVPVPIQYKGTLVGEGRIDLLVDGRLVLELKSVEAILPLHKAQAMGYLRATGLQLALVLNFNVEVLRQGIKRVINAQ